MKDRSYFLRSDINTYKKKFILLCNKCKTEVTIAENVKQTTHHTKRIKIEEYER